MISSAVLPYYSCVMSLKIKQGFLHSHRFSNNIRVTKPPITTIEKIDWYQHPRKWRTSWEFRSIFPPLERCVLQRCFCVNYYTMERCIHLRNFVFPCFRGIGQLFGACRLCCGKTTCITRAFSRTSFCRCASSTNGAEEEKNDNPQLKNMKKGKSKGTVVVNLLETKKEVSLAADLGSVNWWTSLGLAKKLSGDYD